MPDTMQGPPDPKPTPLTANDLTPGPDDWADAVASATDLVRKDEAVTRGAAGRPVGRDFYLVLLGVVVAVAVALGIPRLAGPEPAALAPRDQGSDLREEVAVLVEQIEAYRRENGALPDPEVLRPYLEGGYQYWVTGTRGDEFVVRRTAGGVTVTYDGSLPLGLWLVLGGNSEGGEA